MLAGIALGAAALSRPPPRRSRATSARRGRSTGSAWPPAQPSQVWVETAAGGLLSSDGGRSFRAPLSTSAFQRAQVAQATLLADGKTLIAMPTVWSAQQFTPPRWSSDGGASWQAGALKGADAHYEFGNDPGFVGESPVTADPTRRAHGLVLPGQPLRRRTTPGARWAVATPRFKRPWHCAALAIARRQAAHADPARAVEGQEQQARPRQAAAQRRRRRDVEAAQGAALPAARLQRPRARVRSGAAVDGADDRRQRRQARIALSLHRRRPLLEARAPGRHRCAAPSSTSSRSRATGARSRSCASATASGRCSSRWTAARTGTSRRRFTLGTKSPRGLPLAARGERHVVPARHEPARLLAAGAGRRPLGRPLTDIPPWPSSEQSAGLRRYARRAARTRRRADRRGCAARAAPDRHGPARDRAARARRGSLVCRRGTRRRRGVARRRDRLAALGPADRPHRPGARAAAARRRLSGRARRDWRCRRRRAHRRSCSPPSPRSPAGRCRPSGRACARSGRPSCRRRACAIRPTRSRPGCRSSSSSSGR